MPATARRTPSWEEQLYLLSPQERSPVWENGYSTREFLEACHQDAKAVNRYYTERQCRDLMTLLVQVRGLPSFYFREEAHRAGLQPEVYRRWKIREWPPKELGTEHEIREMAVVLMNVFLRLRNHQDPTKYEDAIERVGDELVRAMRSGRSKNSLSQEIRVRNQAVQALIENGRGRTPNGMCPWEILRRLSERPEGGPKLVDTSLEKILRGPGPERNRVTSRPKPPNEIAFGANCHHCKEGWPTLQFDSSAWVAGYAWNLYICLSCTRENLVRPPDQEMYGPCANCQAPYHQLRGTARDVDSNVVKSCLACKRNSLMALKVAT